MTIFASPTPVIFNTEFRLSLNQECTLSALPTLVLSSEISKQYPEVIILFTQSLCLTQIKVVISTVISLYLSPTRSFTEKVLFFLWFRVQATFSFLAFDRPVLISTVVSNQPNSYLSPKIQSQSFSNVTIVSLFTVWRRNLS